MGLREGRGMVFSILTTGCLKLGVGKKENLELDLRTELRFVWGQERELLKGIERLPLCTNAHF